MKRFIYILLINVIILFHQIYSDLTELQDADNKFSLDKVDKWAKELSNEFYKLASSATQVDELIKGYQKNNAKVEHYDPELTLDHMVDRLSRYLDKRRSLAQVLKTSLEIGDTVYQHPDSMFFEKQSCFEGNIKTRLNCIETQTKRDYRFVDARPDEWYTKEAEMSTMSPHDNDTDFVVNGVWNPNFYNLSVDTVKSAVHVPTPIYKLKPEILEEIYWSGYILDPIFRWRREKEFPAASWQFYCSKQGFMRFYPGALWNMDSGTDRGGIDLYDCRNSEWFIDGATNAKNVLILLDMSGSMFGQRFEIAKQTMETIFESLSENDFFNIITYNTEADFILPYFNRTLVQATLRNKRLMKDYFSNSSKQPENVANLTKALELAFEVLLNLNISSNWSDVRPASDEMDVEEERSPEEQRLLEERRELFMNLVTNKTEKLGCNSAIMLITDGATEYHTNIFNTYNSQKKIRFFSFLIGNDVTQISEVEQMACTNRGYFVHISNLADVQEKVQKYIEVMSRPVAKRNQSRAIWTGAYLDKMFLESEMRPVVYYTPSGAVQTKVMRLPTVPPKGQRLVTTVAYPVIVNSTFRGVVGASAPITELQQMAAVYMLGANAYSFLVDNNGYVMFHPQLRPWHLSKPKPNYNSMDIMELEVLEDNAVPDRIRERFDADLPSNDDLCDLMCYYNALLRYHVEDVMYNHLPGYETTRNDTNDTYIMIPKPVNYHSPLRKHLVDGSSSKNVPKQQLKVLFAMEGMDGLAPRRVYQQENVYFFRALNDTLMTLGLAVPRTSMHRILPGFERNFNYAEIDYKWFNGTNWRLHPDWHYCRPNDTDYMMTKEEIFAHYLKLMKEGNKIPDKCSNYTFLINRLLFDAKVTCQMDSCWISQSRRDARKGVHLVFLATQTGLTRYVDMRLEDVMYELPPVMVTDMNGTATAMPTTHENKPYTPFIKRHTKGLDENFYRRAMRFPDGEFLFDVDATNIVYLKNDSEIFGHLPENKSILVSAMRSVYLGEGESKAPIGVVGLEMLYGSFAEIVSNVTNKECNSNSDKVRCYLLDEHGYIIYTSATNDSALSKYYLGRFFGHSPGIDDDKYFKKQEWPPVPGDRAEAIVFTKLVEKGFYDNLTYIDFQAICSKKDLPETVASAHRLLSPLFHLLKLLKWLIRELAILLTEYHVWSSVGNLVRPVNAYTATFRDSSDGVTCDKWTPFYLMQNEKSSAELLIHHGFSCENNERLQDGACTITAMAARIPRTNLVFVILDVNTDLCKIENCVNTQKRKYWPHFGVKPVVHASDKIFVQSKSEKMQVESRYRRSPNVCYQLEEDDKQECSGAEKGACLALWSCLLSFVLSFWSLLIRIR